MHIHPRFRLDRRLAFTLIEVLVVVTVIAILVGILVPVVGMAKRKAKTAAAVNEVAQVEQALRAYLSDHNGPPTNDLAGVRERDFETRAIPIDGRFAQLLMGENINGDNEGRIRYMEFKRFAADGTPVNGWWRPGSMDLTRNRYYVKFDTDFDGTIVKGRRASVDDPPTQGVKANVIVWTHNGNLDETDADYVIGSWVQ